MCGRYNLTREEASQERLPPVLRDPWATLYPSEPRYNIAPGQMAPVVWQKGEIRPNWDEMKWGFRPKWIKEKSRAQINARAETLFTSGMFKYSAWNRRCLVPATGWYEWKPMPGGRKQAYHFRRKDGGVMMLAGIWTSLQEEGSERENNYAIVTTGPNALSLPIHNRMPVVLEDRYLFDWLDPAIREATTLAPMLKPYGGDELEVYPVSAYVNKPANTGPECIARLAET